MKNGQKLKLGGRHSVSPQELLKRYKRQSFEVPKASPSSSIKISGLSRHFILIVSCTFVLFLECLSFCFWFYFASFGFALVSFKKNRKHQKYLLSFFGFVSSLQGLA